MRRTTGIVVVAGVVAFLAGLLLGELGPTPRARGPWVSYAEAYAALVPSVVTVRVDAPDRRIGSGFAISAHQVVTARHLVVGASEVTLSTHDGRAMRAQVIGTDARTDLALLDAGRVGLPPARLGTSTRLRVGDTVLAIGSPFGLDHSLEVGLVGSRGRALDGAGDGQPDVGFLQLTLPLGPGSSGGPVFDQRGEVVGVLVGTHARGQGIAFAVPVDLLADVLPALAKGERLSRAFLGAATERVDGELVVARVAPGGPAFAAGLRPGDRILAVAGRAVSSPAALRAVLDHLPDARASLAVQRGGRPLAVDVALGDWAEHPVVVAGLTLEPAAGTGGRIVAVRPGSRAERAGLRPGDVVRTVDGLPVQAPGDVQEVLGSGRHAPVEVLRDGSSVLTMLE